MVYQGVIFKHQVLISSHIINLFSLQNSKKIIDLLFLLLVLSSLSQFSSRKVSCDRIGTCKIIYDIGNEYIPTPFGVNLNFIYDKYLKEDSTKYVNQTNNTIVKINSDKLDPNVEMLFGSEYFQCADGFDECPNKCCKFGICSDPSNVCLRQKSNRDLIFVITGSFFSLLLIIYWIVFFYLGIKYNSTFSDGKNIKELDMIYRKPFKKVYSQEAPDTDFNPNTNYEEYFKKKAEDVENYQDLNNINNHSFDKNVLKNDNYIENPNIKNENIVADYCLNEYHNNEFEIKKDIEEDENNNIFEFKNSNTAIIFDYKINEESKSTNNFRINLDKYHYISSMSERSIRYNADNLNHNVDKTPKIISEDNNYHQKIQDYEEQMRKNPISNDKVKEEHDNLKKSNFYIENINDKNTKSLDKDNDIDKDIYDVFSSQNSFPSKSGNQKRRLIRRIKTDKNENALINKAPNQLEENIKFKIEPEEKNNLNENMINEEEKI